MEVVRYPKDIYSLTKTYSKNGKDIGLVPTMGALHEGHFSLIRTALENHQIVVVSVFVNPLQFDKEEDLLRYPQTLEADTEKLKSLGVDVLYCPESSSMYHSRPVVSIDFGELANEMEGFFRPSHFSGVGVVVAKLFHQINPDVAYFGLKDLQQFLLVTRMAEELSFPVKVVGLPTIREESGLAMSSRNQRLSRDGLSMASNIYLGLKLAEKHWKNAKSPQEIVELVKDYYTNVGGLEVEYFYLADPQNLKEITSNNAQSVAFCVAGYVEGVRLIDNLYLVQQ